MQRYFIAIKMSVISIKNRELRLTLFQVMMQGKEFNLEESGAVYGKVIRQDTFKIDHDLAQA